MGSRRCDDHDYIRFLLAAQRVFPCAEGARSQPEKDVSPGAVVARSPARLLGVRADLSMVTEGV